MAHRPRFIDRINAPVRPQIRPADAGGGQPRIASVGFRICGSGRSSTRTSPGAYMTAPRTIDSLILFGLRAISGIAAARSPCQLAVYPDSSVPLEPTTLGNRHERSVGVSIKGCTDKAPQPGQPGRAVVGVSPHKSTSEGRISHFRLYSWRCAEKRGSITA
jgi:hypothetical protein